MTDLSGTARFGGQVCPLEVWLHVQTVSCDDGRLDPAQDRVTETRQRGNVCVPRMVLPTDLGYLALAFHVEGFQPFYVGSESSPGLTGICQN